jgi:hypothetical protein
MASQLEAVIFFNMLIKKLWKVAISCAYLQVQTQFHTIQKLHFTQNTVYMPV